MWYKVSLEMSVRAPDKKIIVIMPAYNAEKTLKKCVGDIPQEWVDEIILTDDASQDRTVAIARELGLHVLVHDRNRGYGANQKTCYTEALRRGADIVVMIHPDHQYDPTVIPQLIQPLINNECDAVFGSRMLGGRPLEGGMPKWKYLANIFLTAIREIPIQTRYFEEASQIGFWRSVIYGLSILKTLIKFKLHVKGIKRFKMFEPKEQSGTSRVEEISSAGGLK